MAHVADYKKKTVKEFVELFKKYPIIGAVNMEDMPGPQLQKMRKQLRGKVVIRMTKRRLIKLAIDIAKKEKPGIEAIEKYLGGMPAILFTNENPFSIYKIIKKSKSKAPAKPGQIAPYDIEVKAGPTQFTPGPIISELAGLGIKSGVEEGKIFIKKDCIIVKEGEVIKDKVASMLLRLGIEPMEIGLNVVAVYEDGVIFGHKVLDVDEKQYLDNLAQAERWAFNLGIEAGICNKKTTEFMVQKAFKESKAISIESGFITDMTAGDILAKAEAQANSVKSAANIE
jgi:large subunit ribosomal protein L10